MDREIVFVFKELEIWSIISPTIHICKAVHNFQGTFTFLISNELHNTLKRGRKVTFPPVKSILILKIKLAYFAYYVEFLSIQKNYCKLKILGISLCR